MLTKALPILTAVVMIAGCHGETDQVANDSPPKTTEQSAAQPLTETQRVSDEETATVIRNLAPRAAGLENDIVSVLANSSSAPNPTSCPTQPLTLLFLCEKGTPLDEKEYAARLSEFRFQEYPARTSKVAHLIMPSGKFGYCSILQPDYITEVTSFVDGDQATGTIAFDAGGYSGRVAYVANRTDDLWQIDEFSFPARRWKFVRTDGDVWQWHDRFGHITEGRKLPVQTVPVEVVGLQRTQVLRRVDFNLRGDPEFTFFTRQGEDGELTVEIVPGEYRVRVEINDWEAGGNYVDIDASPVEVTGGPEQGKLTISIP